MTHHATALPLQWAKKDQSPSMTSEATCARLSAADSASISTARATALGIALRYLEKAAEAAPSRHTGKILPFPLTT